MKIVRKLGLLGSLYFSQGLPYGFFTQALPVLMRKQGLSLPQISLSSLLTLPWALKFLWAPLVDRHHWRGVGARRSWILPLQTAAALTMGALAFTEPRSNLWLLLIVFLVANLLAATQDIATDALAVDLLAPEERGLGNGMQVAGYRVGMIVGGGALLILFDRLGWHGTFLTMGLLLALATLPVFAYREPPVPMAGAKQAEHHWKALLDCLRRPGMPAWLGVLMLYKAGEHFASGMIRPFLVDRKLGMDDIGWLLGAAGFTAGMLGAMLGGYGAGVLGRKRALLWFGGLQALAVAGYWLLARAPGVGMDSYYAACVAEHLAGGMATAALFTMMMDRCRTSEAATDYTLQASVVVVIQGSATALSGYSAQEIGYANHFALAFVGCIVTLLATAALLPHAQASHE